MSDERDFDFWVEDDRVRVRLVSGATLGRMQTGHLVGGDFDKDARVMRLPRYETLGALRAAAMHELGHYLVERQELNPRRATRLPAGTTEEEVVELFAWLPGVLLDSRNGALRAFLGL